MQRTLVSRPQARLQNVTKSSDSGTARASNPGIIYIVDAEEILADLEEEPPDNPEIKISMHAATGIPEDKKKQTFTLQVKIGNTVGLALVDSGSTTTFISPALAAKSGCPATRVKQF